MKGKDLLSVSDLSSEDIRLLISGAIDMKAEGWLFLLDGKIIALMFDKPSLRTRVSFEVAMRQLGGYTILAGSICPKTTEALQTIRNLNSSY